jgi:ferric-dicitrate binding protein FerR (iron transport regulator)
MTKREFNLLSNKYLQGLCTEQEEKLLVEWSEKMDKENYLKIYDAEKNEIKDRIWKNVNSTISKERYSLTTKVTISFLIGIAACFLLVFWGDMKLSLDAPIKSSNLVGMEMKNMTLIDQKILLKDGSLVILKPKSSIVYGKEFNLKKREVFLIGQAFFKVKRNVTKPFIVHSGDLNTEVLGTSFWVRSHVGKNQIEVSVTSGKVSVYSNKVSDNNNNLNGVILTRNQQVVYDVVSKTINPTIVDNPLPNLSSDVLKGELVFQATPLQTVLSTVSKHYGVEIILTNPKSNDCLITADLNGITLFTQLDLVCKSIGAVFEKRGTVIFITGEGCN